MNTIKQKVKNKIEEEDGSQMERKKGYFLFVRQHEGPRKVGITTYWQELDLEARVLERKKSEEHPLKQNTPKRTFH